jgi:hypothetical protein
MPRGNRESFAGAPIEISKKYLAMKLLEPCAIGNTHALVNPIMVPAIVTCLATVEGKCDGCIN